MLRFSTVAHASAHQDVLHSNICCICHDCKLSAETSRGRVRSCMASVAVNLNHCQVSMAFRTCAQFIDLFNPLQSVHSGHTGRAQFTLLIQRACQKSSFHTSDFRAVSARGLLGLNRNVVLAAITRALFVRAGCLAMQIKSKTEKKKDKFFTMDPQQITFDMVRQKLKDIVMTRGKRGVDRNEQVEMLTYLASVAKGPVQKIEVLIQVVSALFDINPSMSTHMSVPLWKRCAGTLLEVLQTLADNEYIEVDEAYDNPEERTEEPPAGQPAKVCTLSAGWLQGRFSFPLGEVQVNSSSQKSVTVGGRGWDVFWTLCPFPSGIFLQEHQICNKRKLPRWSVLVYLKAGA